MKDGSADIGKSSGTPRMGGERYRPYPASKDSGVEWLGQVPEHWEVKRLRFTVTKCQNGLWGDDPDGINDVACVRVADFDRVAGVVKMNQPTLRSVDPMILGGRRLRHNDLLLEKSGGGDNQPVGAVVLNTYGELAICSNFIAQMPVQEGFDPRYLTYVHAAMYSARINTRSIKQNTGIQNLDSENYLNEVAAYPELLEQRAIAVFLDRETARIDALVAKKERLIELLQEKRTALINRAVTKGLDPDVPMKDSGVEWLGEIPAHWALKRVKYLLVGRKGAIKTGPFGSQLHSSEMMDSEIKVFNQRTVIDRDIRGGLNYISKAKFNELKAFETFRGDLLVTTRGTIGRCMIIPSGAPRGILHPCLLRIQIDTRLAYDHYIELLIEESGLILAQLLLMSNSTTIEVIYSDSLKETLLPIPPLPEQRAIAAFLDRETAKIDTLVAKVREAIDRLKELRTALISAAVTGKIDVRQAAA